MRSWFSTPTSKHNMLIRSLIVLLALVLWPAVGWAQFTLVGQDYEECNTSAATCTFGTGVTAQSGDLVIVLISNRDIVGVSSIADGVNTGYTCPAGADFTQASSFRSQACYYINSGAGTVTPVITWASNSRAHVNFQVWRPTGTVTIDSTAEGGNASGTAHVTPTLSTGANAALVVCGFGAGAVTDTPGTGYTALTNVDPSRFWGQYDITSVASGSFTCDTTIDIATQSSGVALSFNDAGGGGATCTGGLMLLGAGKCE